MYKLIKITREIFDSFIKKDKNSTHFMQTSSWGEYKKTTEDVTPHYLGLINIDNNEIKIAALVLERYLPGKYCYFQIPYGPLFNNENKNLLNVFMEKLSAFAKKRNAILIKYNPYIENSNENINEYKEILNEFSQQNKNKNELINLNYQIDLENLENNLKVINNIIEKNNYYSLELTINNKKDLEELLENNKEKEKNYNVLYEIFNQNDETKVRLLSVTLHITKTLKNIEKQIIKINNQMSIIPIDHLDKSLKERLEVFKEQKKVLEDKLKIFKQFKLDYGNTFIINTSLMMEHNKTIWPLKSKTNNLNDMNLDYLIYNEYLNYYKNLGFNKFNQLNPLEENKELTKCQEDFNGYIIEYIGEYNIIINKLLYFIYKHKKQK